jgi:hypothetical protein
MSSHRRRFRRLFIWNGTSGSLKTKRSSLFAEAGVLSGDTCRRFHCTYINQRQVRARRLLASMIRSAFDRPIMHAACGYTFDPAVAAVARLPRGGAKKKGDTGGAPRAVRRGRKKANAAWTSSPTSSAGWKAGNVTDSPPLRQSEGRIARHGPPGGTFSATSYDSSAPSVIADPEVRVRAVPR